MKSKGSSASAGMSGGACLVKLNLEVAKLGSLMAGKARFCDAMLASLVTLG